MERKIRFKSLCKKLFPVFQAAFLLFCFSACNYEGETTIINSASTVPKEENLNFESRSVPYIEDSYSKVSSIFMRFYEENDYLPYVGVKYWLSWCGITVNSLTYSNGEYILLAETQGKTISLVINHKNNTIYCPSWEVFNDSDKDLSFAEGTKFIEITKMFSGQKAITFDLGKYGFKIYAGIEDVYVPFCVMNQLFTCNVLRRQLLYNGKKVYHYTDGELYFDFVDSPWYSDVHNRPQKLVDISYNMLCMTHDYLYGQPGYYGFADDGNGYAKEDVVALADKLPFDEMLMQYDPETRTLLKSKSYVDYIKGLKRLVAYTYGDCHASANWTKVSSNGYVYLTLGNSEIRSAIRSVENSGKKQFRDRKDAELHKAREGAGLEDYGDLKDEKELELIDNGKTLVIRFDSFSMYKAGWDEYYKNPSGEPDPEKLPSDTIGLLYKAFYNIKKDSNEESGDFKDVSTVLFDVSCNGGGLIDCLRWILGYLSKTANITYDDVHTGAKYNEYSYLDLDLDGEVDTAYYVNFIGLNFAVLCSHCSFSAANSFACFAKERGAKILGEQSGGGSCVVSQAVTADGFPFNFSGNMRFCNETFEKTVENGVVPDKDLPYSDFYDNDSLIAALKEVFGKDYPQ